MDEFYSGLKESRARRRKECEFEESMVVRILHFIQNDRKIANMAVHSKQVLRRIYKLLLKDPLLEDHFLRLIVQQLQDDGEKESTPCTAGRIKERRMEDNIRNYLEDLILDVFQKLEEDRQREANGDLIKIEEYVREDVDWGQIPNCEVIHRATQSKKNRKPAENRRLFNRTEKHGNLHFGDKISKIMDIYSYDGYSINVQDVAVVKWKARNRRAGAPENSLVSIRDIRDFCPEELKAYLKEQYPEGIEVRM